MIGHRELDSATTLVRPVDAYERLFYRFAERNPAHFAIVAEFDTVVAAGRVRPALDAVQRRHPLLSVHVEDRPDTRLGFYRARDAAPVDLTVRHNAESSWDGVLAEELARPFDRSRAPLMRACLVRGREWSALLLVFDHTIADGISSVFVLGDVLAAMNGQALPPLPEPPSQEHLTARMLGAIAPSDSALLDDPRMHMPSTFRPFDGAPPNVHTLTMADVDTAMLAQRCRAERTTVHAALVVAMCRVRATEQAESFVRALNPINFRALIGVKGDCGLYFQSAQTGWSSDGAPFWEQARAITASMDDARSPRGILALSLGVQGAMTVGAGTDVAEDVFGRVSPWELLISNLGVQNLDGSGPLRPKAVWGPAVQSQTAGEYATGITTYEGRLRIVACGYSVPATFLKGVADELAAAVEERDQP
ncbi:condensation domain-containing protein [Mycobacterium sp. 050134]|uniref:condensation domain-containing protein n=1 Tax=Mycobacterium sp. 050134 TaxID=3096111 RepID=UPI002EDAC489